MRNQTWHNSTNMITYDLVKGDIMIKNGVDTMTIKLVTCDSLKNNVRG